MDNLLTSDVNFDFVNSSSLNFLFRVAKGFERLDNFSTGVFNLVNQRSEEISHVLIWSC